MSLVRVAKNAVSLSSVQIITYFVPFLTLPYLSRVLNVDSFSATMVIMSICQFGYIFCEFGFNLSATRKIINTEDVAKHAIINGSVVAIKVFSLILYSIIVYFTLKGQGLLLCMVVLLVIFFQTIQPVWYFSAREEFRKMAGFSLVSKAIYLILIFLLVHKSDDVNMVFLSLLLSQLVSFFLYMNLVSKKDLNLHSVIRFELKEIMCDFNEAYKYFFFRVASNLQYFIGAPVLGFYNSTPLVIANFSNADTLGRAMRGITGSVTQALFPYTSKEKNFNQFLVFFLATVTLLMLGSIPLYLMSSEITSFIFGEKYALSGKYFELIIISVICSYSSSSFGHAAFSIFDKNYLANYTAYFSCTVFLILLSILWYLSVLSPEWLILIIIISDLVLLLTRLIMIYLIKVTS